MDRPRLPFLSPTAPQLFPPQAHSRSTSRSPTRLLSPNDDFLSDLSPARAYDLFTNPSGRLKPALEAASQTDRAFGTRAALASKRIQEWVNELENWVWPAEGGSLGFEVPAAKRRKLSTGSEYTHNGIADVQESQYIGSLPARTVAEYETRIDSIHNEMDELNVEEIKRQVLDTHFSPRSRPSSSASNAPTTLTSSYNRMDDFTAIVTAVVLKALPNLSKLMRLMDVWNIRLSVLQRVPRLLRHMRDAETGLKSGWNAIRVGDNNDGDKANEVALSRADLIIMQNVLQAKVTELGQDLDSMLDTLEGRQDTLPDAWLDRMESIEHDYGEWSIAGDRKVREGEWAKAAKKRREEEKRKEEERRKEEEKRKEEERIKEEEKRKQEEEEERKREEEEVKRQEEDAAKLKIQLETEEHRKRQLEEAAALQALHATQQVEADAARARAEKEEQEAAEIRAAKELKAKEEQIKAKKEADEAEIESLRAKEALEAKEVETTEFDNKQGMASSKAFEQPLLEAEDAGPSTLSEPLDVENFHQADQNNGLDWAISSSEAQDAVATHLSAQEKVPEGSTARQLFGSEVRHQQRTFRSEDDSPQLARIRPDERESKEESPKSPAGAVLPANLVSLETRVDEQARSTNRKVEVLTRDSETGISATGVPESVDESQTQEREQQDDLDQTQSIADEIAVTSGTLEDGREPRASESVDIPSNEDIRLQPVASGTNDKLPSEMPMEPLPQITRSSGSLSTSATTVIDQNRNSEEQSQILQAASPSTLDANPIRDADSLSSLAANPRSTEQSEFNSLQASEVEYSNKFPSLDSSLENAVNVVGGDAAASLDSPGNKYAVSSEEQLSPTSNLQKVEEPSELSRQLAPQVNLTKAKDITTLDGPADLGSWNFESETTTEALPESEGRLASHPTPNPTYSEVRHTPVSLDLPSREKARNFVAARQDVLQQSTADNSNPASPIKNLREQASIQGYVAQNRTELFPNSDDHHPIQDGDDEVTFKSSEQEQVGLVSYFSSSSDTEASSEVPDAEPSDYFRSLEPSIPSSLPHDRPMTPKSPFAMSVPPIEEHGFPEFLDSNVSPKSVETRADALKSAIPSSRHLTDINDIKISDGATEDTPRGPKPGVLHTPVLARKTSITRVNSGARRILISRKDSALSSGSVTTNGNSPVKSPIRPSTPPLRRGSIDSLRENDDLSPSIRRHRHVYSSSDSPPSIPDVSKLPNRARNLSTSSTATIDNFATDLPLFKNVGVSATPPASPKKNNSEDQMQQQISSLLESIPARIRLTSEPNFDPPEKLVVKKTRPSGASTLRSSSSMSTYSRAPTPSFTLAPAHTKGPSRQRPQNGHPEIKLYHLSRSTGEAPIKLFVRLVGENGERVMVRVGGGWADLGEYLREYASHHGRRSAAVDDNKVEIQDLPPRVVSSSSSTSTATLRGNERSSPAARPGSAFDRPMSSLNVRKTRKSTGASDLEPPPHASNLRSPSTPLPSSSMRAYQYDTPPSIASSSASNSTSASGKPDYDRSSSRMSWTEEDSSLGLAGPKSKRVVISERDQEWVDSMKEKVRTASAEKEKPKHPGTRKSFGEMEKVGGTKRLFRKS